jgi:acetyltransferase-like isoleucine patch superfamily enzyme
MEISNITLGSNVNIDPSTSINNVRIADRVKIAKYCSIFGSKTQPLEIGKESYVGMFSILNGFAAKLTIGRNVSIAQNVNIMTDSGPNASDFMQKYYPVITGDVTIEDHVWVGAGVIIMPNVHVGRCSIIAANSFVNVDVQPYCLYGGNPARLIKKLEELRGHES